MEDGLAQRDIGYEKFHEALIERRIALGSTLTQSELCEILGMSLSPLRETMTLLQAEGLISVRKRAGVQVFSPDVDFFRANFQMRTLLEKEAVKRFARNAPLNDMESQLATHRRAIADMQAGHDPFDFLDRVARIEEVFHFGIIDAFDNRVIAGAHHKAYLYMRLFRIAHPVPHTLDALIATLGEHVSVLEKCRERDSAGAHEALDAHFLAVMNRVFGFGSA